MLPEDLIWKSPPSEGVMKYSVEQWTIIVEHVLDEFSRFLGCQIDLDEPIESNVGNGFCIGIRSVTIPSLDSNLSFTWKGLLGGTVMDNERRIHISATVFPYINRKKVVTRDGKSFLEFVYHKCEAGRGRWRFEGWMSDEFGEYEYFDVDATGAKTMSLPKPNSDQDLKGMNE